MGKNHIYKLNDKPYELMTEEEFAKRYEENTGKKYKKPTEEEKKEILRKYGLEE